MVQDRGPVTSGITIAITVLATVFVAARFFTRIHLVRSVKQDDWWILAAWVVAVGFSAAICAAVSFGLGKHKVDIPESSFASLRKTEYAFAVMYNPALILTKNSILLFYLSVMSKDVDKIFKWCNWLTLAIVNLAGIALTFFTIFQCSPVWVGYTYPTPKNARCTDIVTLYLSSAPVNIITDLAILFLPMPILTGMRLPKKQKIILVVTFSFGAFVAVVDVIRLAYLQNAALTRLTASREFSNEINRIVDQNDFSWYASLSFMWSAVEVHLGIICACVPSLKPLFLRFLPQFVKDNVDQNTPLQSFDAGRPGSFSEGGPAKGNTSMLNNPAAFRKPAVKEYSGDDDGDNMGFLNMLAGPVDEAPTPTISKSLVRLSRTSTRKSTNSDFDFVSMSGNKNMLKLSNRQSVWPIAVVTIIFFLWGFAYGLLDTLNAQFTRVVNISPRQALGLHAAYFGGYLVGPLSLGRFMLKGYGFKASMMAGLCVYGCGTLVFWPSAVLTSYTAFVISNFVVAFGLSCLEIAANPYVALCGPLEYAEVRLNLSQAFQAVGTIFSPLLATKALFKNVESAQSLIDVQWAYLGIALFVFALAIAFYYIPLPEATDEELDELADRRSAAYRAKIGPFKVIYVTLVLGVFSQWCYVGSQEGVGNNLQTFILAASPNAKMTPFNFQVVGHTVFAVGRFLSAFLNYILKPRWILLALYTGFLITLALQMTVVTGVGAEVNQMMVLFFEAGIFSIIYAISMRGLGSHTKTGSAFMSAAISGGAVFPVFQWAASLDGRGVRYSYCAPLAGAAFGILFPIYLNLFPQARNQVDPIHERRHARRQRKLEQRQDSIASNGASNQFGLAGILARRRKAKRAEDVSFEHVERQSDLATDTSSLPMDEKIHISNVEPVRLQESKGQIGALQPWPGADDIEESSESSQRMEDMITRQRPVWDEKDEDDDDDDGFDDYHATIRKM